MENNLSDLEGNKVCQDFLAVAKAAAVYSNAVECDTLIFLT